MTNDIDNAQYNKVVELGQRALYVAIIINGTAAGAMLAFISSIWSKDFSKVVAILLTFGLVCFSAGVLFAAKHIGETSLVEILRLLNTAKSTVVDKQKAAVKGGKYSLYLFLFGMGTSIAAIFVHFLCSP